MSRFTTWAQTERSERDRIVALIPAGIVLLGLLPYLLLAVLPQLDRRLGLRIFAPGPVSIAFGVLVGVGGLAFGFWAVYLQFTRGRGTPIPMIPTHVLLTGGPYRYCRNPMTFGTILAYLGMSIAAATVSGAALVLAFGAALVTYLKRVEEDELAERFGEDYMAYRQNVPFIIPRIPRAR